MKPDLDRIAEDAERTLRGSNAILLIPHEHVVEFTHALLARLEQEGFVLTEVKPSSVCGVPLAAAKEEGHPLSDKLGMDGLGGASVRVKGKVK